MFEHLDDIVNKYIDMKYFPSAVCRVFDKDETLYAKAYGDVNVDTVFDVASVSKIITSTQILMLINEGKIDLDGKIKSYLPMIDEHLVLKERLSHVTVRELLTHNSGIIDWYPFYSQRGSVFEVMNDVIGKYESVDGTLYSDLNFMILGEVIKSVTGFELEESLEKYIKKPLNISKMCYCPTDETNIAPTSYGNIIEESMCKDRDIKFDGWRDRSIPFVGDVNDGNAYYFFKGIAGHAGIFADALAYEGLCRFYMNTKDELMASSMKEQANGRGLGWQISKEVYPMGCGHSGFTGTSLWICNDQNIGAVIFTNRLYTKGETKNINKFREEMHNCIFHKASKLMLNKN